MRPAARRATLAVATFAILAVPAASASAALHVELTAPQAVAITTDDALDHDVSIAWDADSWVISDAGPGTTVMAGPGCTIVSDAARCNVGAGGTGWSMELTATLGDGDDRLLFDASVPSTNGAVTISGGAGSDELHLPDHVYIGTLNGNDGDDELHGSREAIAAVGLHGGADDDTLLGGDTSDYLFGGAGNDTLRGGPGDDELSGEDDNDLIDGGTGNDQLAGGHLWDGGNRYGNDTLDYSARTAPLTLGTGRGPGNVYTYGAAGEQDAVRGDFAKIVGGSGNDTIYAAIDRSATAGQTVDVDTGDGDDTVDAINAALDTINCGAGIDVATAVDPGDTLIGCNDPAPDPDPTPDPDPDPTPGPDPAPGPSPDYPTYPTYPPPDYPSGPAPDGGANAPSPQPSPGGDETPATPAPGTPGAPAPGGSAAAASMPVTLSLAGKTIRAKNGRFSMRVSCGAPAGCTAVTATYALKLGKRSHRGQIVVPARPAGPATTLSVKLSRKAARAFKRAGSKGGRLTITAGKTQLRAKLKPPVPRKRKR